MLTKPHADLRRARRRDDLDRHAVVRLALLGLIGGILAADRRLADHVFGVPADLTPLLVASVGFLLRLGARAPCSASARPVRRHRAAADARASPRSCSRRSATAPGACASCATPRTALAPVAVGAAATAVAAIGFSLLQFLLGVEAPVSLLLVRQILLTIVLNTLLALPGATRSCAACCSPFLPDDPRRRRRRAYTTGGLSPLSRA